MRQWAPAGLPRLSGRWPVLISFLAGVACTALLHTRLWPPHSASSGEISLQIHPQGSRLLVEWDPKSFPVLQGFSGILTVQDGGKQLRVPLDRDQLQRGSTTYTPVSEWAEFRLEIYRDGNHYSGEAIALATGFKAPESPPAVDRALPEAVPRVGFEEVRVPLGGTAPQAEGTGKPSPFAPVSASGGQVSAESARAALTPPPQGAIRTALASSPPSGAQPPGLRQLSSRELSPSAALALANTAVPAVVEDSPPSINLQQKEPSLVASLSLPHPSPLPEAPVPSGLRDSSVTRTYDGIIVDAACAGPTLHAGNNGHESCVISPATATFALRLKDGHTIRFDSVGNLRAQTAKRKNRWVAKTIAGQEIRARVSGAIAGNELIVVSIE
jgi:hypothetical protein